MKFKKILFLFILLFCFSLNTVKAEEVKYRDVIADIVGIEASEKVTVYIFHQNSCRHCKDAIKFLDSIKNKYDIEIKKYEVSGSKENSNYLSKARAAFLQSGNGVPFIVIGTQTFTGYNNVIGNDIENVIKSYIDSLPIKEGEKTLPIIGKVNVKNVSIPLVATILGLLDGFNPCAMWILLFLINMLFNMKNRKRMWILGLTFLFTSAFVYFLAMLGINSLFSIFNAKIMQILIAIVALIGGIVNIRIYIKTKDSGCHVVDSTKRKKYFEKIKKFTSEKSFVLSMIGVIALAASVNIVELACSAGFPSVFIEILNINDLSTFQDVMYILLYVLFFLLDDIVIFIIAMVTLKATGISTKYNRFSHLIGGILMILIGLLLVFKPEWLMFNFK